MTKLIISLFSLAIVVLIFKLITNKYRVSYQQVSRQREWSEQEETFLRNNAGEIHPKDISKELKRTKYSIYNKAKRLGINLKVYAD